MRVSAAAAYRADVSGLAARLVDAEAHAARERDTWDCLSRIVAWRRAWQSFGRSAVIAAVAAVASLALLMGLLLTSARFLPWRVLFFLAMFGGLPVAIGIALWRRRRSLPPAFAAVAAGAGEAQDPLDRAARLMAIDGRELALGPDGRDLVSAAKAATWGRLGLAVAFGWIYILVSLPIEWRLHGGFFLEACLAALVGFAAACVDVALLRKRLLARDFGARVHLAWLLSAGSALLVAVFTIRSDATHLVCMTALFSAFYFTRTPIVSRLDRDEATLALTLAQATT